MKSHERRDTTVVEVLGDHHAQEYGSLDPDKLALGHKLFLILNEWDDEAAPKASPESQINPANVTATFRNAASGPEV